MRNDCVQGLTAFVLVVWGLTGSGCGFSEAYRKTTAMFEAAHQARLSW